MKPWLEMLQGWNTDRSGMVKGLAVGQGYVNDRSENDRKWTRNMPEKEKAV